MQEGPGASGLASDEVIIRIHRLIPRGAIPDLQVDDVLVGLVGKSMSVTSPGPEPRAHARCKVGGALIGV